jgi:8-oxo-dGTP diphosphatase
MDEDHLVATAVLVNSDRVLLCHRHPDRRWYPNVWDVPGGHIDVGESPADAVRRELLEELGVSIRLDDTTPWRVYKLAPDLTLHAWVATDWSGTVTNLAPEEHDEPGVAVLPCSDRFRGVLERVGWSPNIANERTSRYCGGGGLAAF